MSDATLCEPGPPPRFGDSARHLLDLAWPVFVGQVAVLAFSTIDTLLAARHSSLDLAALAVGAAAYISIFVGLMGTVFALAPIAGRLFGAGRDAEAGEQLHQGIWLALMLSVPGCVLLLVPEPFLALAKTPPEVALLVRHYMQALAFALPASLMFTAFRSFNTAVSRPRVVMFLQLGGLVLKVPLSALLVFGAQVPMPGAWGGPWAIPSLGAAGCGIATAIVMWCQLLAAWQTMRRDRFYERFHLRGRPLSRPHWASQRALLRLGIPMGLSILVEVTGFTFMAFFISRIGVVAVAGHQIAANLVALMYMVPLAIANASSTLVAQRIGARAPRSARRVGWHALQIGLGFAALLGAAVLFLRPWIARVYSQDPAVIAAALPLLAWAAAFHLADATQVIVSYVLRAWHVATVPLLIYCLSVWGIGLGGGFAIAFDVGGLAPDKLRGASGFWFAATVGLVCAALLLSAFLAWTMRGKARAATPVSRAA